MRSPPQESRLARAAAAGDGEAFAQLYDLYERPVYNYCLRLLGSEHDAQDATQEAFLRVMRRLPRLGERELEFGPYLYTVARNASYDMIGRRKRATPVEEFRVGVGQPLGDGPALDEDPVRSALLAAEQDAIRAANARLPERQREALALRELEDMSYEQIADLLAMNSNSVAQLISRARIRLRAELRGEAAGAIAATTPDCERALPLLARRQDGKLDGDADGSWLDSHLAVCATCPIAVEAMAEAGASYRAWTPVVPAAWLFRDTLAKAAEQVGADWSGVQPPDGEGVRADGAARSSSPDDRDGSVGPGRGADTETPLDEPGRRRRRGLLVGSFAALVLLLGGLAVTAIGGESEETTPRVSAPQSEEPAPSRPAPEPVADEADAEPKKPGKAVRKRKTAPAGDRAPEVGNPAPPSMPTGSTPTETVPAPPATGTPDPARPEPASRTRPGRDRAADGTGPRGDRSGPRRPRPTGNPGPAPAPSPPANVPLAPDPAPQPAPTPAPQPPDSPEPDPGQPGSPNDPPVDDGDPPPATTPCRPVAACPVP